MNIQVGQSLLWREATVFDGVRTLPGPMAVRVDCDRITGVWPETEFDPPRAEGCAEAGRGGLMTPGLVDCHTHLVFGGSRADEFEQRLEGVSYAEIARAGGGILSTVRATRAAGPDQFFDAALPGLQARVDDDDLQAHLLRHRRGEGDAATRHPRLLLVIAPQHQLLRVFHRL